MITDCGLLFQAVFAILSMAWTCNIKSGNAAPNSSARSLWRFHMRSWDAAKLGVFAAVVLIKAWSSSPRSVQPPGWYDRRIRYRMAAGQRVLLPTRSAFNSSGSVGISSVVTRCSSRWAATTLSTVWDIAHINNGIVNGIKPWAVK